MRSTTTRDGKKKSAERKQNQKSSQRIKRIANNTNNKTRIKREDGQRRVHQNRKKTETKRNKQRMEQDSSGPNKKVKHSNL